MGGQYDIATPSHTFDLERTMSVRHESAVNGGSRNGKVDFDHAFAGRALDYDVPQKFPAARWVRLAPLAHVPPLEVVTTGCQGWSRSGWPLALVSIPGDRGLVGGWAVLASTPNTSCLGARRCPPLRRYAAPKAAMREAAEARQACMSMHATSRRPI